jgi:hypothetical protein
LDRQEFIKVALPAEDIVPPFPDCKFFLIFFNHRVPIFHM